jgi:hypothetical protein
VEYLLFTMMRSVCHRYPLGYFPDSFSTHSGE